MTATMMIGEVANCSTCLHAQWVTEDWGWCEMAETTDHGHTLGSLARARTRKGMPASLRIERHYGCVQWNGKESTTPPLAVGLVPGTAR